MENTYTITESVSSTESRKVKVKKSDLTDSQRDLLAASFIKAYRDLPADVKSKIRTAIGHKIRS